MKKSLFLMPLLASVAMLTAAGASAKDWYVTGTGNDSNNGTSLATAFRNPSKAATLVQPGDTVHIGAGNYTAPATSGAVLALTTSGTSSAWITWEAIPGQSAPEIDSTNWQGIFISAAYQIIDGINVVGPNDSLTLAAAQADEKNANPNPLYNGNGITIDGRGNPTNAKPHHIIIRNCVVGKNAGGGIASLEADYLTYQNNTVYNNAWYGRYAGSGISNLDGWAHDSAPGYHNIIEGNIVHDNKALVIWSQIGKLSDGNGIILDYTNYDPGEANGSARPAWNGRTLVANNISFNNGGSGIHAYEHQHADIVNNTLFNNGLVVGYPNLFANTGTDIVFLNNVIYPTSAGGPASAGFWDSSNITWDYNSYTVLPPDPNFVKGAHDIVGDPGFATSGPEFSLSAGSTSVDSGTTQLAPATDILGNPRPSGKGIDRGAYELQVASPPTVVQANATLLYNNQSYSTPKVTFAKNGTYQIVVSAKGSVCGGGWPIMQLNVGSYSSSQTVATTSYQNYTFNAPVTAGSYPVTLTFTNDCYLENSDGTYQDRNLYINTVTVNSTPN